MVTANAVLDQARADIGMGADPNGITRQYGPGGWGISRLTGGYDWCAVSTYVWARRAGDSRLVSADPFVSGHVAFHQARGSWLGRTLSPRPGDEIMFDWEQDGGYSHVAYVESVANGRVNTIEGNSGDAVRRRSYLLTDPRIAGYGRPAYSGAGTAGGGAVPIEERKEPMTAICQVIRKGVGSFYMVASPSIVSLSIELSTQTPDRQAFEKRVFQALALSLGLGPDYNIPLIDDSPNGGWYVRNVIAQKIAGMPADFPLSTANPYIVPRGGAAGSVALTAEDRQAIIDGLKDALKFPTKFAGDLS